jgi:hypothetical protein
MILPARKYSPTVEQVRMTWGPPQKKHFALEGLLGEDEMGGRGRYGSVFCAGSGALTSWRDLGGAQACAAAGAKQTSLV